MALVVLLMQTIHSAENFSMKEGEMNSVRIINNSTFSAHFSNTAIALKPITVLVRIIMFFNYHIVPSLLHIGMSISCETRNDSFSLLHSVGGFCHSQPKMKKKNKNASHSPYQETVTTASCNKWQQCNSNYRGSLSSEDQQRT